MNSIIGNKSSLLKASFTKSGSFKQDMTTAHRREQSLKKESNEFVNTFSQNSMYKRPEKLKQSAS